jgi:hypothetical protein
VSKSDGSQPSLALSCKGISIFGAALNAELRKRLSLIEGFGTAFNIPVTAQDYRAIHSLPDEVMRNQVIKAFSDSASVSGDACSLEGV